MALDLKHQRMCDRFGHFIKGSTAVEPRWRQIDLTLSKTSSDPSGNIDAIKAELLELEIFLMDIVTIE
jgi:hypothetical protein